MKIGLGTVQFGTDYGLSNTLGQVALDDVARILDRAERRGIRILDTAALYGDSERVLGTVLAGTDRFDIVTKTPKFKHANRIADVHARELTDVFHRSLTRLGRDSVYGLLAHRADDLLAPGGERLFDAMYRLKESGRVDRIGVSVYYERHLEQLIGRFPVDLVQLPLNVFDQRMLRSGWVDRLNAERIEIHARSPFLQGAVTMAPESLPAHFGELREKADAFHSYVSDHGLTPIQAALAFLAAVDAVDVVLCGVVTTGQLDEIVDAADVARVLRHPERFAVGDLADIDPTTWPPRPS